MNYWLIKSEPSAYSIDDLKKDKATAWTGIRNYQARNFMKSMEIGDLALFYHSSSEPMGAFGVAEVASKPHVDLTQFNKKDEHYDPKATEEKPIWYCVDFKFVKKFKRPLTLQEMKRHPQLEGMLAIKKGYRLSVQPVSEKHFKFINRNVLLNVKDAL